MTSFVGKRSDTIKSFRIFLSQSLTGIGAALSGFYTSNKTMICHRVSDHCRDRDSISKTMAPRSDPRKQ